MAKKLLPVAAMERILKEGGADRVSLEAMQALKRALEDHGIELARKAAILAKHAGRKTIKASDIELAKKE